MARRAHRGLLLCGARSAASISLTRARADNESAGGAISAAPRARISSLSWRLTPGGKCLHNNHRYGAYGVTLNAGARSRRGEQRAVAQARRGVAQNSMAYL